MQNYYNDTLATVAGQTPTVVSPKKYGVSEQKKSDIDAMQIEVTNAEYNVAQYQSIVNSLTEKVATFTAYLATAETNQATALSNKNLVDAVLQDAIDLLLNSEIAFNQIVEADIMVRDVAADMKDVIDKLIFALQIINRVDALVQSKKALNPIISDELVSTIQTASANGNIAVSNCLIALQSCYIATSTTAEAEFASSLEVVHSKVLIMMLTGEKETKDSQGKLKDLVKKSIQKFRKEGVSIPDKDDSLYWMLQKAYDNSVLEYNRQLNALTHVEDELDEAQTELDKAEINLASLQRALSAAQAAALAS